MPEVDKTIFRKVFGNSPYIKVLDFFLDNDVWDYSKSTIAEGSGISRITLEPILRRLLQLNIVKQTRTDGNSIMYQLSKENELTQKLLDIDLQLCKPKILAKHRVY